MVLQNYVNQLVTYLLDKLIGKYVDNFTSINVQTGLYQGDIKLVNLPLKRDVLQDITDLPIKVQKGTIGSVVLRIPYTQLRSQAWAVLLDEIYIVASLDGDRKFWSKEKLLDKEEKIRKELLESLESKWWKKILQQKAKSNADNTDNSWMSYVASLGYRILRNIQIEVKNVHIRFEDSSTMPSLTYSIGFIIDELSAKSSDFDWESKKNPDVNSSIVNKLVHLKGIGLYLDPNVKDVFNPGDNRKLKVILQEKLAKLPDWYFIIQPISISGVTRRYTTPLPLVDKPRIELQMEIDQLEVSLSQSQFRACVSVMNELDRMDNQRQHIKNRPAIPITGNATIWWRYAIKENQTIHSTLEQRLEKTRQLCKYISLYEKHLLKVGNNNGAGTTASSGSGGGSVSTKQSKKPSTQKSAISTPGAATTRSKDDQTELEEESNARFQLEYEKNQDLDVIVALRELAMERTYLKFKELSQKDSVNKDGNSDSQLTKKDNNVPAISNSWWSYIWPAKSYNKAATQNNSSAATAAAAISQEMLQEELSTDSATSEIIKQALPQQNIEGINKDIEKEFSEILHEVDIDAVNFFTRDRTFLKSHFQLSSIKVSLRTSPQHVLVHTQASELSVKFEARPQFASWSLMTTVSNLVISDDNFRESGVPVVSSISPDSSAASKEEIFFLVYEKNPLGLLETEGVDVKHRLLVRSQPLKIVHSPFFIKNIRKFFANHRSNRNIRAAAKRHLLNAKIKTSKSLRQMIEQDNEANIDRWQISLQISAPQILIRQSSANQKSDPSCLLIDLGQLRVSNCQDTKLERFYRESFQKLLKSSEENNDDQGEEDDEDDDFFTPISSPTQNNSAVDTKELLRQVSDRLSLQPNQNCLYESYAVRLEQARVLIGGQKQLDESINQLYPGSSLRRRRIKNTRKIGLVQPCNLKLELKRMIRKQKPGDENTSFDGANIILQSKLPELLITISDEKLKKVKECLVILGENEAMNEETDDINQESVTVTSSTSTSVTSPKKRSLSRKSTLDLRHSPLQKKTTNTTRTRPQVTADFILHKFTVQMETNRRPLAELTLSEVHASCVKYRGTVSNISNGNSTGNHVSIQKAHVEASSESLFVLNMSLYSLVLADARANLGDGLDFVIASHQETYMDDNTRPGNNDNCSSDNKEPLIKLKFTQSHARHDLQITFSDVSVIANQETLSELISLGNSFQESTTNRNLTPSKPTQLEISQTNQITESNYVGESIHFEMISTRLSILLVRNSYMEQCNSFIDTNSEIIDTVHNIKVGLVVLSNMKLAYKSNGPKETLESSLETIQITDMLNPSSPYNTILSLADQNNDSTNHNQDGSISVCATKTRNNSANPASDYTWNAVGNFPHFVYLHSPFFLHNVEKCISDFQHHLSKIKQDIQTRASKEITAGQFLSNITIDLKMLSPILILPKHPTSDEVFVIKLGDIRISKCKLDNPEIDIVFSDANVVSKVLDDKESCVKMMLQYNENDFPVINSVNFLWKLSKTNSNIQILLSVNPSLSISMTKQVYEQILQSTDNLVYDEEEEDDKSHLKLKEHCLSRESSEEQPHHSYPTNVIEDEPSLDESLPIIVKSNFRRIEVNLFADNDTETAPVSSCVANQKAGNAQSRDPVIMTALKGLSLKFTRHNKYIKDFQVIISQLTLDQVLDRTGHRIYKPLIYSSSPSNSSTHIATAHNDRSSRTPRRKYKVPDNKAGIATTNTTSINNSLFRTNSCPDLVLVPESRATRIKSSTSVSTSGNTTQTIADLDNSDITEEESQSRLMVVNVRLVDKKISSFSTEFASFNRFVKVDFNQLTLCISLEIWVIMLDFFGLGSRFYDPEDLSKLTDVSKVQPDVNRKYDGEFEEIINTSLDVSMNQLTVQFENQVKYSSEKWSDLMSLTCLDMRLSSTTKDGNLDIKGSVSDFHMCDLSPTGSIYYYRMFPAEIKERIFEFEFFKYGVPDIELVRSEDVRVSVKISAPIVYIHTQRFLQEVVQFTQNFMQYQDRLREIRVMSAGRTVDKSAPRSSRILLDISCHAPLLVLPVSAYSDHLLVADLGHLTVSNKFEMTSTQVLLDNMSIHLTDMDLYTAAKVIQVHGSAEEDQKQDESVIRLPYLAFLPSLPRPFRDHKPSLIIDVVRNLDCNITHEVPDWHISAQLSSIRAWLDLNQYRTVRGVLCHNLGENIDFLKAYQYQAFQTDPKLITPLTGESWVGMKFGIYLVDVQVNLLHAEDPSVTLCRINFLRTHLSYCSFSDGKRVIELDSDHIALEDRRYIDWAVNKRLNVFPVILTPDLSASKANEKISSQVHIYYETSSTNNVFNVQLSKMQIMVIFNWLRLTNDWIFTDPYDSISLYSANYTRTNNTNNTNKKRNRHLHHHQQQPPSSHQAEFEHRANCYLQANNWERTQSLEATLRYRQVTMEIFRPTLVCIEAQESQFRVLEDIRRLHSPAIILTLAGTLKYTTREDQPPSFSLDIAQLHLASCCMPLDTSNTLLSIINPLEIRLVSSDLTLNPKSNDSADLIMTSVSIKMSFFKIRLSFHDMTLLASIFSSLIRQSSPPANVSHQSDDVKRRWASANGNTTNSTVINPSLTLSSSVTHSQVFSAQNPPKPSMIQMLTKSISRVSLEHIKPTHNFVSICLIDDCIDADVPLFDLRISQFHSDLSISTNEIHKQNEYDKYDWLLKFYGYISLDYYNTNQFVWTPIIVEPWQFEWSFAVLKAIDENSQNRKWVELRSTNEKAKRLEFDISAHLLQIAKQTQQKWAQQLKQFHWTNAPNVTDSIGTKNLASSTQIDTTRRWRPNMTYQLEEFAPFLIENHVGVDIQFRKLALNSNPLITLEARFNKQMGSWEKVGDNQVLPVCFESEMTARDRIRYNKHGVHCDYRHRIELQIPGWKKSYPLTVDTLGVFYRDMPRDISTSIADFPDSDESFSDDEQVIRIVIEITRQGSVQNKITVRSALMIHNTIHVPLEIKLTNRSQPNKKSANHILNLAPLSTRPIPIYYTLNYSISVRPVPPIKYPTQTFFTSISGTIGSPNVSFNSSSTSNMCASPSYNAAKVCLYNEQVEFSSSIVHWSQVNASSSYKYDQELTCPASFPWINPEPVYMICTVERLNFPSNYSSNQDLYLPAHFITFSAPFTLDNLLPCDLKFSSTLCRNPDEDISFHENLAPMTTVTMGTLDTPPISITTRHRSSLELINKQTTHQRTNPASSPSHDSKLTCVRPSNKCSVLNCSSRFMLRLFVSLETFPRCSPLFIPGDSRLNNQVIICVFDELGRVLELQAQVDSRPNGPVNVKLFSPFWIINKTSLPLVFSQATSDHPPASTVSNSDQSESEIGLKSVTAGYMEDYERARSPQPLLFSLTNKNEDMMLQMRLGKETPGIVDFSLGRVIPHWSQNISIDKQGTTTVQLRATLATKPANKNQAQSARTNRMPSFSSRPPITFNIGLEVRPGRGPHSVTKMVILTARYILDNRSSLPLHFAQYQCITMTSGEESKPIMALPNSVMTFHWPREDFVPLLSVQKLNQNHEIISRWSGGFLIDKINSFHIFLKGTSGLESSQLRITVAHEGAIFRVTFTDVAGLPSPYQLTNETALQLFFYQDITESSQIQHHLLPPHTTLQYALDYPTEPAIVHLSIEGGTQASFYLDDIRDTSSTTTTTSSSNNSQQQQQQHFYHHKRQDSTSMYYDNFLYLTVLEEKQSLVSDGSLEARPIMPLVFDVPQNSRRIILRRKTPGSRAQLWYYSHNHELFHEGSVAPHDPKQRLDRFDESHLLLDIAMLAPQPSSEQHRSQHYQLILAKPDSKRAKYQRWFFSDGGCLYNKFGIKCTIDRFIEGAVVTSGYEANSNYFIYKEYLRPGSGIVDVSVFAEGPTRVVRITDRDEEEERLKQIKSDKANKKASVINWNSSSSRRMVDGGSSSSSDRIDVTVQLDGMGLFLLEENSEELVYVGLEGVWLRWARNSRTADSEFSNYEDSCRGSRVEQCQFEIQRVQIDNQLPGALFPCVLFEQSWKQQNFATSGTTQTTTSDSKQLVRSSGLNIPSTHSYSRHMSSQSADKRPAFTLRFERQLGHQYNIHVFNYIKARLVGITVLLEERLILKVLQMFNNSSLSSSRHGSLRPSGKEDDELFVLYSNQAVANSSFIMGSDRTNASKNVYIGKLQLLTGTITLSVITADTLTPDLKKIKKLIPSLMGFTNAQIYIEPYDEEHVFNSSQLILESMVSHIRSQLRGQAIKIFGTVDFLGNPMGFITDISSAMRLFYAEKNIKSMVQHFAHGIGDSTAKLCGSAGKLVSELALDPAYAAKRQELFEAARHSDSKSAQMVAGVKSFWHGIYGGIKSVPSQSWRGYKDEGASGFFLGTIKGVLGIVTKPVGGMLDLATGTATSFREMARSSREGQPGRFHTPRPQNIVTPATISTRSLLLQRSEDDRNDDASDDSSSLVIQVGDYHVGGSGGNRGESKGLEFVTKSRLIRAQKILQNARNDSLTLLTTQSSASITNSPSTNTDSSTYSISSASNQSNERILGFIPMQQTILKSNQSSTSTNDLEILITNRSLFIIRNSSTRILKYFDFSKLSVPPVNIVRQDGSIYIRICQKLTVPASLSGSPLPIHKSPSGSITSGSSNVTNQHLYENSHLTSGSASYSNLRNIHSSSIGPLFKCDNEEIAQLIVDLLCEAYIDFLESVFTIC